MVIGTGIDIVDINRIERLMARWGDVFLDRVFTEKEIIWCQRRTRPPECFAIRFAAKERSDGETFVLFSSKGKGDSREPPNSKGSSHPFPRPTLCRGPCAIRGRT